MKVPVHSEAASMDKTVDPYPPRLYSSPTSSPRPVIRLDTLRYPSRLLTSKATYGEPSVAFQLSKAPLSITDLTQRPCYKTKWVT